MTAIANVTPIHSRVDVVRPAAASSSAALPGAARAVPVQTGFRLTRRGRVVFGGLTTILVAAVLAVIAAFSAPGAIANGDQGSADFPYVYVESGDTLWSIAAELDPSADTRDVVAEIKRLNQLPSSGLQAGDAIAVPLRFAGNGLTFPASDLRG